MPDLSDPKPQPPNPSRRRLFTWLTDRIAVGAVGAEAGRIVRETKEAAQGLVDIGAEAASALAVAPSPDIAPTQPSSEANADLHAEFLRLTDAVATVQTQGAADRQILAEITSGLQQVQRMIEERLPQAQSEAERTGLHWLRGLLQSLITVFVTNTGAALYEALVGDAVYAPLRDWVLAQMQSQPVSPLLSPLPAPKSPIPMLAQTSDRRWDGRTLQIGDCPPLEFVQVPAGWFLMGSDKRKWPDALDDETPQHWVYLDGFHIGRTPVTVAQFAAFVTIAGYMTQSEQSGWGWSWQQVLGEPGVTVQRYDHPVSSVTWNDAQAFCRWADVHLPTEAQWEKAARSTDGRLYPWGDAPPRDRFCHIGEHFGDTAPVGGYPAGASPYGALDMVGNVWEWTADWYERNDYAQSPLINPTGPPISRNSEHAVRGGWWHYDNGIVKCARVTNRTSLNGVDYSDLGFRVVLRLGP